jgi:hypothetical protein
MPGTNQILQFAGGGGANVLTPTQYAALASIVANGFQSGVLPSNQLNVVLRQSAFVSAMIAQFIADKSGQNVNDDGNLATLEANFIAAISAAGPGRLLNVQVISASGTYTPTPGMATCIPEVVGGGGGGGGSPATSGTQFALAGGGGSGAYGKGRFTAAQIGASQTATIGAAGAAGAVGGAGGTGGTSSLGALISAPGGSGGGAGIATTTSVANITTGGLGASVATGGNIINSKGAPGGHGFNSGGSGALTGYGAGSPVAGGGGGGNFGGVGTTGNAASSPGAGGAGGGSNVSDAGKAGGAGAAGIIIIWEFA